MNINITYYNKEELVIDKDLDFSELKETILEDDRVYWISIKNLEPEKEIELCKFYNIHEIVCRDLHDEDKNSKYENFGDYVFIILKLARFKDKDYEEIEYKTISMVIKVGKMLTFVDEDIDILDCVKNRIKDNEVLRNKDTNILFYIILDKVLDDYFDTIENLGERIDDLEDELLIDPTNETLEKIYNLKRNLVLIRKTLWSIRNAINNLSLNPLYSDSNSNYYLRASYDDCIQLIDLVETYREICSGMLDTYLSSIGNKTNEVMKVLTIATMIFTPLTFYTGLFAMTMKTTISYVIFWSLTIGSLIYMIIMFKDKGWI